MLLKQLFIRFKRIHQAGIAAFHDNIENIWMFKIDKNDDENDEHEPITLGEIYRNALSILLLGYFLTIFIICFENVK